MIPRRKKRESVHKSMQNIKKRLPSLADGYSADDLIARRLQSEWTEVGRRKRTCHVCREVIPKGDRHVGIHTKDACGWNHRKNICMFCVDTLSKVLKQKVSWRKRLKKRLLDRFIESI